LRLFAYATISFTRNSVKCWRCPLVLFLALELENENLLRAVVRRDGGDHLGVCQLRFGKRFAVFEHREHIGKLQRRAYIERQLFDADHVAGGHPVLFPACLNDCVHGTSSAAGHTESARPNGLIQHLTPSGAEITNSLNPPKCPT
jgi:hypothetical protein